MISLFERCRTLQANMGEVRRAEDREGGGGSTLQVMLRGRSVAIRLCPYGGRPQGLGGRCRLQAAGMCTCISFIRRRELLPPEKCSPDCDMQQLSDYLLNNATSSLALLKLNRGICECELLYHG